ncbi:hypothetical protein B9479_001774 [Cryptococcus floricola]|uniref:Cytochrome b5 heme-binding domain-containing protein n=1 Tax=Cryptococcus floricola TaxID=2591691 RepID=A0A5D3B130_9TREE|nr:hypothetical protein B9479_001774 [Cryptococcus floricola]
MSHPEDVYANREEDWYPGVRQRSKPGQAPHEQVYDTTRDINGNVVTDKPANRAILSAQKRQRTHDARVLAQRQKQQAARAQSGQTEESSTAGMLGRMLMVLLFLPLLSSFTTQSYTFNLSPYFVPPLKRFWAETPLNPWKLEMKEFTPLQLAMYDGSLDRPVYLAVDGVVFDVTSNRRIYGKGGSYSMMTGRDASRAFVTGCFETHLTHDLRGLSEDELKSVTHWKKFFENNEKYTKIGTVLNPPIDPSTPIPPPCRGEKKDKADPHAPGAAAAQRGRAKPGPVGH